MNKNSTHKHKRIEIIWPNILLQPLLGVVFMLVVLLALNAFATSPILWAIGAGSLASSCFLVFGQPAAPAANPRRIIGGYFTGMITGGLISLFISKFYTFNSNFLQHDHLLYLIGIFAALAVGICLILMALLDIEHPPAAGIAVVLIVNIRDYDVLAVIAIGAITLALLRYLLRHHLKNLNIYNKLC